MFHASLLIKKNIGPNAISHPLPTCMNDDWCLESGPEEALDTRRNFLGDVEVLIKWKELQEFENSWESMDTLRKVFTGFLLEVKENFEGGN